MKSEVLWVEKFDDRSEDCVYDLCFSPDGKQIIVGSQNVLVFEGSKGSLIQILKGHKEVVYCVAYSKDGKKFASGSADKSVILWTNKLEGILKFAHAEAIQSLQFNPVSHQLLSCSLVDIAVWSSEQKSIHKHKTNGRVNCCGWTKDGQYMALGMAGGYVSIRYKNCEEKLRIDRSGESPIWTLSWGLSRDDFSDVLCIGEWSGILSFYTITGRLIGKERSLNFTPLKITHISNDQYILITGSNKQCLLFSHDGIQLATICTFSAWTWSCSANADASNVIVGCQDGTVSNIALTWEPISAMYKERYVYREIMTDVIIQNLVTNQKIKIKCRDLIKKLGVYRDRLAFQLSERIVIYEPSGSPDGMHYRIKEKLSKSLDCEFFAVTTNNLILCQDHRVQSLSYSGDMEREWILDGRISCIRVVGGPPGRESLALGLENGQVVEIYLDNPFSATVAKVDGCVRVVDVSSTKERIAVLTDRNQLSVFDVYADKKIQELNGVTSVAFNTAFDDMMCYTCGEHLCIKVANFSDYKQKFVGQVVSVTGSKLHCSHGASLEAIQIPLTSMMYQYLESEAYDKAYEIACLGVTDADWLALGTAALNNLQFTIAYAAFSKIKKLQYVETVSLIEEKLKSGEYGRDACMAAAAAAMGQLREAAKLYQKAGLQQEALNMYSDLRMFDSAQEFIPSGNVQDKTLLLTRRAEWARSLGEPRAAAEMFLAAGDVHKAVQIISEHGWTDMLIKVGRQLDRADRESLGVIAKKLKDLGATHGAAEIYGRLGDDVEVAQVLAEAHAWNEAFELAERNPKLRASVYGPYARWLAETGKFSEAQAAFQMAGHPEESIAVLKMLCRNAITENRFRDASYFYWLLSQITLDLPKTAEEIKTEFMECYNKADIYYAYHEIYKYSQEPFTSLMPEALFNISKFLLTKIQGLNIEGVSKLLIIYTLVKQARALGAYKLAMQLLDQLKGMKIPKNLLPQIESWVISVKAHPYRDPEELLPLCNRCSTYNSLIPTGDSSGSSCSQCGLKFQYSFVMFEILPLVEFELERGLTHEEAERLINEPVQSDDFITIENQMTVNSTENDLFMARLVQYEDKVGSTLIVGRDVLKNMDPSTIVIVKWPKPLEIKYYRNLLPDIQITVCKTCLKLFHTDDYEVALLRYNQCPFCRMPSKVNNY